MQKFVSSIYFIIKILHVSQFQVKNEPPLSKESNQESIAPDYSQKEILTGTIELQPENDNVNTDDYNL